jgi:hypothetical protein
MEQSDLQSRFDELVSKYMTLKKQVFEDIMLNKDKRDKYYNYYGKSVFYDGAYWYINEYGTAHKYNPGEKTWANKSKSCPQKITGSLDLSEFTKGPNMAASQACGVAGNNIMNEDSGEIAWVDIQGNKHVYSSDAYVNRPSVCNKEPIILSSIEYNAIPEGPPMTKNDYCLTANINEDEYKKLLDLNKEIMAVAKKLSLQIPDLRNVDEKTQISVENERKKLLQRIKTLENEELKINEHITKLNTLSMESEDHQMENNMYSSSTLMYMLSTALLGFMAYKLL